MFAKLKKLRKTNLGKILLNFKREFWTAVAISAVVNLLMLTPTLYMLQIFDRVMISQSVLTLVAITLVIILFYAVQALGEWLRSRLIISAGIRMDYALNVPVFRATFMDQLRTSGNSPSQAFGDLSVIRQWLTGSGLFAILDMPWTPIYVFVMFLLHPLLGWFTLVCMATLAAFAWVHTQITRDATDDSEEEERELNKFLYTKLQNAEVIEAHGMVPSLRRQWWQRQTEMIASQARATDLEERMTAASKQLRFLMNSLALGLGAFLVIRGELTIGAMIAASLLMSRALSPIDAMVSGWRAFLSVRKCFYRIESLLSDFADVAAAISPVSIIGKLELNGVSAKASGRDEPILKDLSAVFPAGQVYAVLGPSGAGKSTLGKVILGIWPETDGTVLLDEKDIHLFDRDALGPFLGYLPQDIELFRGSVAMNIARMGEVDAIKVIEAAKRTNTHDFILGLPLGYDSEIDNRGSNLSGGQRQRVALARAIYGTPRLLVLDEPDANLDQLGDQALRNAIQTLKEQGSTVFLITHRPNIQDLADQVIFMREGEIVFYGPRLVFEAQRRAGQSAASGGHIDDNDPAVDAEPVTV